MNWKTFTLGAKGYSDLNSPNVIVIREQFSHMGRKSGYDRVCDYLLDNGEDLEIIWLKHSASSIILKPLLFALRLCRLITMPWYGPDNLLAEGRAIRRSSSRNSLVHVLYAENNLGLLAFQRFKSNNKLVATAHQPLTWWQKNRINLRRVGVVVDALVVLSRSEKSAFEQAIDCPVYFVPHGVDTDYWTPPHPDGAGERQGHAEKHCLFVGQWLRDFDTLLDVVTRMQSSNRSVIFDVVVPPRAMKRPENRSCLELLRASENVLWHEAISDEMLRDLYRHADVLVMPLLDSTANNSILEAMACGLPIVTTQVGGIGDYVDDGFATICSKGNAEAMVEALDRICLDESKRLSMGRHARDAAVSRFDWRVIANQMASLYRSVTTDGK